MKEKNKHDLFSKSESYNTPDAERGHGNVGIWSVNRAELSPHTIFIHDSSTSNYSCGHLRFPRGAARTASKCHQVRSLTRQRT